LDTEKNKQNKLRNRKYNKGDYVGTQKVKMLTDYWIPEGKNRSQKRAIFECPFCKEPFEASLDHVIRGRTNAKISCGCQLPYNKYKVGQKIGKYNVEILELFPIEKTESSHKDRKAKFKCVDCGDSFITTIKEVSKKGRKSCGCTLRKQKPKKGQTLNNIEVVEPNIKKHKDFDRYISKFKCPFCDEVFEWQNTYIRNGSKTSCGCQNVKSKGEIVLYEFIQSLTDKEITQNSRILDLKEIDVYIEDLAIGFEYNGLYWHSEGIRGKTKDYHLNKTNVANQKGIQLLHIFEHQWINKQDIIKDLIKKRLGIVTNKIYARKCTLVELSTKEAKDFINDNHLQGYSSSTLKYGLIYNNDLVSIMTFGKSRFSNKHDYELIRFCNKLGTSVIGGASKLLKYFERNFKGTLVSYCDKSIFDGSLYESLGFYFTHESKPNYYYFKEGSLEVLNRQKFMKHKLKDKLEVYDSNLTEYENMLNNDYLRYWDCGNKVYIKHIK